MKRAGIFCALLSLPAIAIANVAEADCKKGQVLVKQKSALRRGPGLNYPVTTMVDEGTCWKVLERSSDDQWMMVEQKDTIGWVPASIVADDDRAEVLKQDKKKATGPIGSGQERGFVVTRIAAALLTKPDVDSEAHRVLPAGSKLLALSLTKDGSLVEVRDERGETGWVAARGLTDEGAVLPTLPRMDGGLSGSGAVSEKSTAKSGSGSARSGSGSGSGSKTDLKTTNAGDNRVIPKDELGGSATTQPPTGATASSITLELGALIALPQHKLESNGAAGYRRYTMNAFATGAHIEAKADALTPMRLRMAYDFVLLTGLEQAGAPNKAVSGQQHDARLLIGYPILADIVRIVPELGYSFSLFTMDPALPGSTDVQFVSNHTHSGYVGASVAFLFTEDFSVEVEAAGTIGPTIEFPIDLGGAKLALGARGGVGAGFQLGGGAGLVARWQITHRNAPFAGPSTTDPTITNAAIKHTENSFALGLSFAL